jgi:hypothetical protein
LGSDWPFYSLKHILFEAGFGVEFDAGAILSEN